MPRPDPPNGDPAPTASPPDFDLIIGLCPRPNDADGLDPQGGPLPSAASFAVHRLGGSWRFEVREGGGAHHAVVLGPDATATEAIEALFAAVEAVGDARRAVADASAIVAG